MTKLTKPFGGRTSDSAEPTGSVEAALTRLVLQMTGELVETKNRVALAKRDEARLAKQAEVEAQAAEEWGQRAMSAVRAGDDVVAKGALVQKREHERAADEVRAAHEKQREGVLRSTAELSEKSFRVEEAKRRKDAILGQAKGARAERLVASLVAQARERSPLELFDRIAAVLVVLEQDAKVARELSERSLASGAAAEGNARRAENELVVLKQLAKAPATRAKKPLAKTMAGTNDDAGGRRAQAGASRERRTKR